MYEKAIHLLNFQNGDIRGSEKIKKQTTVHLPKLAIKHKTKIMSTKKYNQIKVTILAIKY